jgi:hypothetical protein
VPAGYEQLRVFKEALACLPENVETVRLRSDTAGYQHELLNIVKWAWIIVLEESNLPLAVM